jgi:hypothetical protein
VIVIERARWTPLVRCVIVTHAAVGLCYLPLGLRVAEQLAGESAGLEWISHRLDLVVWFRGFVISSARIFTDIGGSSFFNELMRLGLLPLGIAVFAVVVLVRKARWESSLLVLLLAAVSTLPIAAADLIEGGVRSWQLRYQFPSVIAIQLCVAFAIGRLLTGGDRRQRIAGALFAAIFVVAGSVSAFGISRAEVWWHSGGGANMPAVTSYLSTLDQPTLIVPFRRGFRVNYLLALAYHLDDHVRLLLIDRQPWPLPEPGDRQVFIFDANRDQRSWFSNHGCRVEPVAGTVLYRITRDPDVTSSLRSASEARRGRGSAAP